MTTHVLTPLAIALLLWIVNGLRHGRPDWLDRRTGLLDEFDGNAPPHQAI